MSPAGYWPQLRAAVEAGADSVYFGLKHFTARAKVGFSLEELPEVFRTLHGRGVRGFVTFNTLIFEHEVREAARAIAAIAESGADALIIQDVAGMRLAREIAPGIELHASTQMSVTDPAGVRFAQELGASRVTLARELSLSEVRAIREAVACDLEIFVHGALCVAYSGQCYSSEAWGGRSANRGQCAQACRLPYEMVVDGNIRPAGDARYLLSPGDLYTVPQVSDILQTGVAALKIEGRYKDAGYVALTTAAYREAVDRAWAGQGLPPEAAQSTERRLAQVYSRGFGPHFLTGTNHQAVVRGRAPRHRGVPAGRVVQCLRGGAVLIEAADLGTAPLKPGDGVVFDAADWRSPEEPEEGGRLFAVNQIRPGVLELRFGKGAIEVDRIRPGDLVWRTHDPAIDKAVRPFLDPGAPVMRQAIRLEVQAQDGALLRTRWSLVKRPGIAVEVEGTEPLAASRGSAPTPEMFREQLGRLGGTPYELAEFHLEQTGSPFIPASVLNRIRRDAVQKLSALQEQPAHVPVGDPDAVLTSLRAALRVTEDEDRPARLHVLVRTREQLDAAMEAAPASITLDYLDLYGLQPSVERVRAAGLEVRVASPRIVKPGEERILDFLLRLGTPLLARNVAVLRAAAGRVPVTGDFSFNAANAIAAELLLRQGLFRITPTHDLNGEQVAELARAVGPSQVEAIVYQHLPVFHTEHCVFCRFLSTGTTYRDCGRPCESHQLALRDIGGREHPVLADVGCRNTVFGAEAQEASRYLQTWRRAGVADFRVEFAHETSREAGAVIRAFAGALAGELSATALARELKRISPQGTTEGSLFVAPGYAELPVLG